MFGKILKGFLPRLQLRDGTSHYRSYSKFVEGSCLLLVGYKTENVKTRGAQYNNGDADHLFSDNSGESESENNAGGESKDDAGKENKDDTSGEGKVNNGEVGKNNNDGKNNSNNGEKDKNDAGGNNKTLNVKSKIGDGDEIPNLDEIVVGKLTFYYVTNPLVDISVRSTVAGKEGENNTDKKGENDIGGEDKNNNGREDKNDNSKEAEDNTGRNDEILNVKSKIRNGDKTSNWDEITIDKLTFCYIANPFVNTSIHKIIASDHLVIPLIVPLVLPLSGFSALGIAAPSFLALNCPVFSSSNLPIPGSPTLLQLGLFVVSLVSLNTFSHNLSLTSHINGATVNLLVKVIANLFGDNLYIITHLFYNGCTSE